MMKPVTIAVIATTTVSSSADQQGRHHPRRDQPLHRVDAHHPERVDLLAHVAGAEVGGDRRAHRTGDHQRGHQRRALAEHADAVDGAAERGRADLSGDGADLDRDDHAERDRHQDRRAAATPGS